MQTEDRKRSGINESDRGEVQIEFYYGRWHTRYMAALINLQEGYLVSDTGRIFSMSSEFCSMVMDYQERQEAEYEEANGNENKIAD